MASNAAEAGRGCKPVAVLRSTQAGPAIVTCPPKSRPSRQILATRFETIEVADHLIFLPQATASCEGA